MSSLFSLYRFVGYPAFLLLLISSFKPLWSGKIVGIISIFLSLLRFNLCPIISYLGESSMYRKKTLFWYCWMEYSVYVVCT